MVRPVLGAAWGDDEYEARTEAPDPDLDRLHELADDEDYAASIGPDNRGPPESGL